ncbi:MAG: 30S ribosomal protein S6 [Deltaproteobacteria bacterium]
MPAYECMIAYHPETGEVGVQEQLERARQFIVAEGGEVSETHEWGTRDLAYPIQKQKRGLFYVIEFKGNGAAVAELERNLRIADSVLRYITVRVDPNRGPLELDGKPRRDEAEEEKAEKDAPAAEGVAPEASAAPAAEAES